MKNFHTLSKKLRWLCIALCFVFSGHFMASYVQSRELVQTDESNLYFANSHQTTTQLQEQPTVIIFETTKGDIQVELFTDQAPITTDNFITYVQEGFYDGVIFHRVIPNFMIQGGGFTVDMQQKDTHPLIKNEADNGLSNTRGTLAMARTQVVESATAQFFINLSNNDFLNHGGRDFGYAVFGEVVAGMEVVDAIAGVATGNKAGHQDVPVEPVVITKARVVSPSTKSL